MRFERLLRSTPVLILLALALVLGANSPVSLGVSRSSLEGSILLAGFALVFFVCIPALIIRFLYKEPLTAYGFRWPLITKRTLGIFAVALLAGALPFIFLLPLPEFQSFYSLEGHPLYAVLLFLVPISLTYYFAEEFLFRGFLTFGLFTRIGYWTLPLLAIVFGLLHTGKPTLEIAYAGLVAVMFSWLSLETKSFVPAMLLHFVLALSFTLAVNLWYAPVTEGAFRF